ncbi:MAG: SMC-Scp complex subunit ScpB [Deltaproteobacteria bacterium]|nr:MAG: SMC-Scp complex subunit ScpB [Deltaproteobacteria bacterium]
MRKPKPKAPMFPPQKAPWDPAVLSHPLSGPTEALLFASDRPLSAEDIQRIFANADIRASLEQIQGALNEMHRLYSDSSRGMHLIEVAGGFQFRSNQQYTKLIRKLFQFRPPRLSTAALECLSTVAYRQPVTRSEIDAIRGVDSGGVLRSLIERRLIIVVGRHNAPGRPYLYGTSPEFLEFFGLNNLTELPNMAGMLTPEQGEADPNAASDYILAQATEDEPLPEDFMPEPVETPELQDGSSDEPVDEGPSA